MTEIPENGVMVTLKDIYVVMRRLEDAVNAMTPHGEKLADHENRLRALERWRYALPTALVIAVASIVGDTLILIYK